MQALVFSIDAEGNARFLVNDDTRGFLASGAVIRRASHVEPVNALLRFAFHALRVFGDAGRIASFTRLWPCLWRVNLSPSCGPILPGAWRNRQQAISAEVEYLNKNFI